MAFSGTCISGGYRISYVVGVYRLGNAVSDLLNQMHNKLCSVWNLVLLCLKGGILGCALELTLIGWNQ